MDPKDDNEAIVQFYNCKRFKFIFKYQINIGIIIFARIHIVIHVHMQVWQKPEKQHLQRGFLRALLTPPRVHYSFRQIEPNMLQRELTRQQQECLLRIWDKIVSALTNKQLYKKDD